MLVEENEVTKRWHEYFMDFLGAGEDGIKQSEIHVKGIRTENQIVPSETKQGK